MDCRAALAMTVLRLAMTKMGVRLTIIFFYSGTLPPMSYGSQRAVLLFKCAACAVVLSFAGVARSYGGACCLCEAVRPWQSMFVTPRGLRGGLPRRYASRNDGVLSLTHCAAQFLLSLYVVACRAYLKISNSALHL